MKPTRRAFLGLGALAVSAAVTRPAVAKGPASVPGVFIVSSFGATGMYAGAFTSLAAAFIAASRWTRATGREATIYVAPGHTETLTPPLNGPPLAAVIGMSRGSSRPTFRA